MNQITVDHEWIETIQQADGVPIKREHKVHLVIGGPADMMMGIRRSLLIEEQRALWEKEKDDLAGQGWRVIDLIAAQILRTQLFPSLVAGVVSQEGFESWPIAFERFQLLPEELGIKWEKAVAELNPHWTPKPDPETLEELEEARKKAMSGTQE